MVYSTGRSHSIILIIAGISNFFSIVPLSEFSVTTQELRDSRNNRLM
jgi:hypothetical protein